MEEPPRTRGAGVFAFTRDRLELLQHPLDVRPKVALHVVELTLHAFRSRVRHGVDPRRRSVQAGGCPKLVSRCSWLVVPKLGSARFGNTKEPEMHGHPETTLEGVRLSAAPPVELLLLALMLCT